MSFSSAVTRLSDPHNVSTSPRQFHDNATKISNCMTRMFRHASNGGHPFLFSLSAPKPHELTDQVPTAATDGKKFYWNPNWLESMDQDQVATVMAHEAYHGLFFHCSPSRSGGLDPHIWNVAVDYIVNGVILTDHETSGRAQKVPTDKLYQGVLGTPVKLAGYLEWIDGIRADLPEPLCFADITTHGRSPESMYEEIRKHYLASPRRCRGKDPATGTNRPATNGNGTGCGSMLIDPKTGISTKGPGPFDPPLCPDCGAEPGGGRGPGSLDSHLPSQQTKDEVMGDMMRAAEQTRAMGRGSVPGDIEDALGKLREPELSPRDLIRGSLYQKKIDCGSNNDWKRFRRRPEHIYKKDDKGVYKPANRLFTPKKHDFTANVCVLLDTSGSMSQDDMAAGISQLQAISHLATIHITPNDAAPHWDKTLQVTQKTQLQNVNVVGRCGTGFDQYFKELPQQPWYKGCDVVVVITDGDVNHVPKDLLPKSADVVWVLTSGLKGFKPNAGRVCNIRPAHA